MKKLKIEINLGVWYLIPFTTGWRKEYRSAEVVGKTNKFLCFSLYREKSCKVTDYTENL